MIKLGIIGTGGIAQLFVDAAQKSDYFKLTTVYSRHEETGQAFLKENNVSGDIYTDLERFLLKAIFQLFILLRLIVYILLKLKQLFWLIRMSSLKNLL